MKNKGSIMSRLMKIIGLVCLPVLAAILIGSILVRAESKERGVHTLTCYDTRYNEGPLMVGYFEIDGGKPAMCVCHEMEPPTEIGTHLQEIAEYTFENRAHELFRKIYYYGWQGPGDVGASYVETCLAGSVANGHDDNYYGYGQAFINRIAGLPDAPKGFNVTILSNGNGAHQSLGFWEYHPVGYAVLKKTAIDAGCADGQLRYSLEGAVYGVYRDSGCTDKVQELKTNAEGNSETTELSCGDYWVKELSAPIGYVEDEHVYKITVKPDVVSELLVTDRLIRGDFQLLKKDEEADQPMAGVSFQIVCQETGETHIFTTDENGYYSSSAEYVRHTYNTNGGQAGDGLWFGMNGEGNQADPDDSCGALPIGTYMITEMMNEANEGKVPWSGQISISEDNEMINLGTILNQNVIISTTAKEKESGSQNALPEAEVTIIDTVSYRGLCEGREYTLRATLMDKKTEKEVLDKNGLPVTAELIFTVEEAEGSVDVPITFDASGLEESDVVVFEKLYEEENLIARHEDITDEGQTIHFGKKPVPPKEDEPVTKEPERIEKVKTGDGANITLLVISCILSCVGILCCVRIARKTK